MLAQAMSQGPDEYKRVREEIKSAYEFKMDHEAENEAFTDVEKGFRAMILGVDELGLNARGLIGIGNPYHTTLDMENKKNFQFNEDNNRVSFRAGALHGQKDDFIEGGHHAPNSAKGIAAEQDPFLRKDSTVNEDYMKEVLFNPLMRNDDEEEFMQVIHHTPSGGRRLSTELRLKKQWQEAEKARVEETKRAHTVTKDPFAGLQKRYEQQKNVRMEPVAY